MKLLSEIIKEESFFVDYYTILVLEKFPNEKTYAYRTPEDKHLKFPKNEQEIINSFIVAGVPKEEAERYFLKVKKEYGSYDAQLINGKLEPMSAKITGKTYP